jgi:hypothetical protein
VLSAGRQRGLISCAGDKQVICQSNLVVLGCIVSNGQTREDNSARSSAIQCEKLDWRSGREYLLLLL